MLTSAGVLEDLRGAGPFTVFVPSNSAITKASGRVRELTDPASKDRLKRWADYLIVREKVPLDTLKTRTLLSTRLGQRLDVSTGTGESVLVDRVVVPKGGPIDCTNGELYVLDSAFFPVEMGVVDALEVTGRHSTFLSLLKSAGLADIFTGTADYTVFAPSDESMARLPAGVLDLLKSPGHHDALVAHLKLYIVPGRLYLFGTPGPDTPSLAGTALKLTGSDGKYVIQGVPITKLNQDATDGVIQTIDGLLADPAQVTPSR